MSRRLWVFSAVVAVLIAGVVWLWIAPITLSSVALTDSSASGSDNTGALPGKETTVICPPLTPTKNYQLTPSPQGDVSYSDQQYASMVAECDVVRGNRAQVLQLSSTALAAIAVIGFVVLGRRDSNDPVVAEPGRSSETSDPSSQG